MPSLIRCASRSEGFAAQSEQSSVHLSLVFRLPRLIKPDCASHKSDGYFGGYIPALERTRRELFQRLQRLEKRRLFSLGLFKVCLKCNGGV